MQNITVQQVDALAPNAAAAANGKKISAKGGFVRLLCSADDSFYMGECTGSGSKNYQTVADFSEGNVPSCSCSCPSRQIPCKHSLALLYEIAAKKAFDICEIPDEIVKKREKRKQRAEKAQQQAENLTDSSVNKTRNKASEKARLKKIQTQQDGIVQLKKMILELLEAGLGTMGGMTLAGYKQLAKQLGDYYLPGPQRLFQALILEMEAFQKDGNEIHYEAAIKILEKLWMLTKKAEQYLDKKLKNEDADLDDNTLYEELGGIWKVTELEEVGCGRMNLSMMQLAFWVTNDRAASQFVDAGYWVNLADGEVSVTYNYRPWRVTNLRQDDSILGVAEIPKAVVYPGEGNQRIRWEYAVIRPENDSDRAILCSVAKPLSIAVKQAKNILKSPFSNHFYTAFVCFEKIEKYGEKIVLFDKGKETILLRDMPEMDATTEWMEIAIKQDTGTYQAILGAFWFDLETRRIYMQPFALVGEKQILRLLY